MKCPKCDALALDSERVCCHCHTPLNSSFGSSRAVDRVGPAMAILGMFVGYIVFADPGAIQAKHFIVGFVCIAPFVLLFLVVWAFTKRR